MPASYDFDAVIDRSSVPGEKWGRYAGRDVLPLWVADMDFAAPPAVLEALRQRIDHGVFGYADAWPSLVEAVVEGIARDHGWRIEPEWLVWLPGVVTGFNVACRAVGERGDAVLTNTPVYPPFLTAPGLSERELQASPMRRRGERWECDLDDMTRVVTPRTRLLMLCSPHNPTGRVFDRTELGAIAALAERHDLIICSDEIHCGLVLDPNRPHMPIAALDEAVARRTITLMAPSKTWNIAALYCAFAVIPDTALRHRFRATMRGIVPHPNLLGMVATEAAYREGGAWRNALLDYLRANREAVVAEVNGMPGLSACRPEATYLAWIDCRDTGIAAPADFFEQAGVGLSDGAPFGLPGFVRLNFACPRSTLDTALQRMRHALDAR